MDRWGVVVWMHVLGASAVFGVGLANARPQHTECPYEPPLNTNGQFEVGLIPKRSYFGPLPDQLSVLGPHAAGVAADYHRASSSGTEREWSNKLLARYGASFGHAAILLESPLHLEAGDREVPTALENDVTATFGLGIRKLGAFLGGYVHYGYGARANFVLGGTEMTSGPIRALRPFDHVPSADDDGLPISITQELRFDVAGCHAPFAHITVQERAYKDALAASFGFPIALMVGGYPFARLPAPFFHRVGIGIEVSLLYAQLDPTSDERSLRVRGRFLVEVPLDFMRVGFSGGTMAGDGLADRAAQLYVQVVP
jgi:hypothetical protein